MAKDYTRRMLSIIREATESAFSNEGIPVTDDAKFGDKTLTTQKESFKKIIKSNVEFGSNPLIYYPNDRDLVFAGIITDLNNLKFQFRSNDPSGDGCYIWVDGLSLSDDNLKKINLIRNYYVDWKNKLIENPLF